MNLEGIKNYWLESSNEDFDTAETLFKNNKFSPSMFFLHLAIEKNLKALFIHKNKKEPPFGHNLTTIASKIKDVNFDKTKLKEFAIISTFNIQTRYNDYRRDFHNICDKNFADKYLSIGKDLILWLKSQMK